MSKEALSCAELLQELRSLADPKNVEGMARFGINPKRALGISVADLRSLAKRAAKDHAIALELWSSGTHEAQILASMLDVPAQVTEEQAETWVSRFDSWDLCDQCVMNLLWKTPFAWRKALEWCSREETFEKRAGFAMIARLAWSDRGAPDSAFDELLEVIVRESADPRNFVKKAVNWALRQIGKRNARLNTAAIAAAQRIEAAAATQSTREAAAAAKWIASDALRELTSEPVKRRLAI